MTSFKVAAILATLLGGAGSAQAAIVTVVNPLTFGGFETAGETAAQWTPSPGFSAAKFTIGGNNQFYQGVYEGQVTTSSSSVWQYTGLQDLAVQAGTTITVQAYVFPNTDSDAFGISYGTTGSVVVTQTPTSVYHFTSANVNSDAYIPVTFTFAAPSSNIDIDFGFLSQWNTSPMYIDNVSVTYDAADPVPEPASAAVLGAALLGLGLTRRRFGSISGMLVRQSGAG